MGVHQIQAPDGTIHAIEAPDDASPDDIVTFFQQNYNQSPTPDKPGFFGRMGQDISKRANQGMEALQREQSGQQGFNLTNLDILGAAGGLVGDTFGNVAGSAGRAINDYLIPQPVDDIAAKAAQAISDSAVGRTVKQGAGYIANKYNQFAESNPTGAQILGDVGNIATVLPIGKATKAVQETVGQVPGAILSKVGQGVAGAGETLAANRQGAFVKNLVMPKETKKVLEDQVGRTTQTRILGRKIVEPSSLEQATIDEVSKIPGIKKGNSNQLNYNIIDHAKNHEAQNLLKSLENSNIIYNPAEFGTKLDDVLVNLKSDPLIVGDAEKTAERIVGKMQDLIRQNDGTPKGLLKARQEFDSWAKSKKGSVFDANETAFSSAVRDTRQAANDFLGQLVPDAQVGASLKRQSLLYRALDNIEPKAATEGKTRLGRLAKSASDKIPISNPILKGAAQLAGLGGLAAAPVVAPIATGLAVTGIGALKMLPATLKAAGYTLGKAGQLMRGGKPLTLEAIMKLPAKEGTSLLSKLKNTKIRIEKAG